MTDLDFNIDQIFMNQAYYQAQLAFEKDEVPVGAVIVHDEQIVAKAHNQVEMLKDPTAHAEMLAITQAVSTLGTKWLTDCTVYVTLEPCSMCAGALVLARIKRLVYATEDPKSGACGSVVNIARNNDLNHLIDVHPGLMRGECSEILSDFFKQKRHKLN